MNAILQRIQNDPTLSETMAEILRIQPRCSAEPVFGKTGKGYLKSAGVEELRQLKIKSKSR